MLMTSTTGNCSSLPNNTSHLNNNNGGLPSSASSASDFGGGDDEVHIGQNICKCKGALDLICCNGI